jgi:hypothetical protein
MEGRPVTTAASGWIGTCPDCGKQRYASRKTARHAARRQSRAALSAYPCGAYWHIGHLPRVIAQGDASRQDLTTWRPNG